MVGLGFDTSRWIFKLFLHGIPRYCCALFSSRPPPPFKKTQIPSNRDHKARNRATLGVLGLINQRQEVRTEESELVMCSPGSGCSGSVFEHCFVTVACGRSRMI